MAGVLRWSVTYTKHLKQKRKVYHDGVVVLHSSINKVMLYDESETLLECRILKDEEVVRSGESLTFNAYLVDVGDPEGQLRASDDSNDSTMHRKDFKSPTISAGGQSSRIEKTKARKFSLSPSQKIIREFKKREVHKYGTLPRSANSVEPSGTVFEWQVLYTTQLTQKAKKYHDGFLRCQNNGAMSRQVMLYDESWKLLESRFMKMGEEVRTGETMEFHGHLVEIGERKENLETLPATDAKGHGFSSFRKLEMPKQQNGVNVGKSVIKEWQVLYTTQLAQKVKKYHDGYLQLVTCGSIGQQVMLFDASRKLIDNKFLKKDEIIRPGAPVEFNAHLVDNLEPEGWEEAKPNPNEQEIFSGVTRKIRTGNGNLSCTEVNLSIKGVHSSEKAGAVKNASTDSGSFSLEKQESSLAFLKDKPIRDALGILSILQKPAHKEGIAAECANNSVALTLDSSTKRFRESDTCAVHSSDDNQTQSVVAPSATSIEQPTENTGINSSASHDGSKDGESKEKELIAGSAVDERKIHEVESASDVKDERPCFDLGF